jgi:Mg-chelatase subunit ChlI
MDNLLIAENVSKALLAVVDAVRDRIIPDGISDEEFFTRVLAATDNPEITPCIRELENGRS